VGPLARLRYRAGTARIGLRRSLDRPVRHRRPLFSLERECRRDVQRHRAVLADSAVGLGEWESHQPVLVELLTREPGARVLERSRQGNLLKLASRARFIVCHDTEECFKLSAADHRWDFSSFAHVWTRKRFPNYTTVASTVEAIPLDALGGVHDQPPPRR